MSMYTKARTLFLLRGVFSEKYSFFSSQCVFHVYSLHDLHYIFFFFVLPSLLYCTVLNTHFSLRRTVLSGIKMERIAFRFFFILLFLSEKGNICICSPFHCTQFFFFLLLFGLVHSDRSDLKVVCFKK